MAVINATSLQAFNDAVNSKPNAVAYFWAPWCEPCAFIDQALASLSARAPAIALVRVEAEEVPDVTTAAEVVAVPTFVYYRGGALTGERVEGPHVADVSTKVLELQAAEGGGGPAAAQDAAPFPTSTLVGADGSAASAAKWTPEALRALTRREPVMLFMKGTPEAPRCGFSRRTAEALERAGVAFGSFDILSDEGVRQGLKAVSDWPTYPQLFANGELVGGCDIVAELAAVGRLKADIDEILQGAGGDAGEDKAGGDVAERTVEGRIKELLARSPVMLFMKGTPEAPRCGFSRKVVEALRSHAIDFEAFDILGDEEIRQGLKVYSDWPTYPQLYANGDLVGGCDIVLEMAGDGSLKSSVAEMLAEG